MNWISVQPRPTPPSRRGSASRELALSETTRGEMTRGEMTRSEWTRSERTRREPVLGLPPPQRREEPLGPNMRDVSPRDFAEFTYELYLGGELSWPEYRMVGFPSELDPRWDETIGALTGEKAEPDRRRDMLIEWERRVDFMRRYQAGDTAALLAERIHDVLSRYAVDMT